VFDGGCDLTWEGRESVFTNNDLMLAFVDRKRLIREIKHGKRQVAAQMRALMHTFMEGVVTRTIGSAWSALEHRSIKQKTVCFD